MHHYEECYYCVCTACSRSRCPWAYWLYLHCFACQERGKRSPRLHCDNFEHYLKVHRYRFKRVRSVPFHHGTYILNTHDTVFVGNWDKLYKLAQHLGGIPKKLNILDWWIDKNET